MGMLLRPTEMGHAVLWLVAQDLDQLPKAEGAGTAANAADSRSGAATSGTGAATSGTGAATAGTAAATPGTAAASLRRRRSPPVVVAEGRGQEGWRRCSKALCEE